MLIFLQRESNKEILANINQVAENQHDSILERKEKIEDDKETCVKRIATFENSELPRISSKFNDCLLNQDGATESSSDYY